MSHQAIVRALRIRCAAVCNPLGLLGWAIPLIWGGSAWAQRGLEFVEETATRLPTGAGLNDPAISTADGEEKDYAWGDVDQDGDVDLVVVRKQPFTTAVGFRNVLFMNEGASEGHPVDGVLVDRTSTFAPDLLDATNDRDVQMADLNGDGWLDVITAVSYGADEPTTISHPRVYINQQSSGGMWQGFAYEPARIPIFPSHPNFTAVAVGDVTGEGDPDLYFVDHDGPASNTFEDRLLINDGKGFFVDESALRMSSAMLGSSYGTNTVIFDMNGDAWNDVVKSENGLIETLNNAGDGFFDVHDTTFSGATYNFTVGFLDEPAPFVGGTPDLVQQDDRTDRWLRNLGNDEAGLAEYQTLLLPAVTGGFGGNTRVVDLDGNGWNDILVADVDVDVSSCVRIMDILLNDGNPPENTFTSFEGIPTSARNGTYDAAAFDINNDGALDLVLGRCAGTQVWIQVPPVYVAFSFPSGLPSGVIPPGVPIDIDVEVIAIGGVLEAGSVQFHYAVNGGEFSSIPLTPAGGDLFLATIPAMDCLDQVQFYFSAAIEGQGQMHKSPTNAPGSTYGVTVSTGTQVMVEDDLEGPVDGWIVINEPGLSNGGWEHVDPVGTMYEGQPAAPEDDASEAGAMAFVTGNGLPGQDAGVHDVDGGPTRLVSPPLDFSGVAISIHYRRWVFSATGAPDTLITEVSNNDGQTWAYVDAASDTGGAWEEHSFVVAEYVKPTDVVRVRFTMCDCPNDSISEAGIDDLAVERVVCTEPCAADLNGDGSINAADLAMLIGAWGRNPGHVADLNGDGTVNAADLAMVIGNWGACP